MTRRRSVPAGPLARIFAARRLASSVSIAALVLLSGGAAAQSDVGDWMNDVGAVVGAADKCGERQDRLVRTERSLMERAQKRSATEREYLAAQRSYYMGRLRGEREQVLRGPGTCAAALGQLDGLR